MIANKIKSFVDRLERGTAEKRLALTALYYGRILEPETEWKLVSWTIEGDKLFSACRKVGSTLGDRARIHTESEVLS